MHTSHTNLPIPSEPTVVDGCESVVSLDESYRYCETLTRERARNFYYGIRLTPKAKRRAMYALYAWTRLADDLADDASSAEAAREQLDLFRRHTLEVVESSLTDVISHSPPTTSSVVDSPIWPAFGEVVHEYPIDVGDLTAMIDGQFDDLTTTTRQSFDDLYKYCDRVASTVGRSCLAIWGYRKDSEALQLAEYRGVALQLTNILRDLREDYEQGRVYLPAEDFERFEITAAQFSAWEFPDRCERFMRFQGERALSYYEKSQSLESLISPDCIATSLGLMMIYRRLLDRIMNDPRAVVGHQRIGLSSFEKMKTALSAVQRARKYKQRRSPVDSSPGGGLV